MMALGVRLIRFGSICPNPTDKDEDFESLSHPYDHLISKSYVEPSDDKKQWVDISFGSGEIKGYFV